MSRVSRGGRVAAVGILGACASAPPTSASWLTGFAVGWEASNHRLGALTLQPTQDGAQAAFVGGASTTGIWFGQGGSCNAEGDCFELPIEDRSTVGVTVARAVEAPLTLATARASLDLTGQGDTEVRLPLRSASGGAVAWLGSLAWDLQRPLPAEAASRSCYDPRHGWLPTVLGVSLGTPRVDGDAWVVDVEARFGSGLTYEENRACLDAVAAEALGRLTVDVVLAEGTTARALAVTQAGAWPWSPGQDVPAQGIDEVGPLDVDLPLDAVVGWQAATWTFHEVVDVGRGAYLRTLALVADPASGEAYGHATNAANKLVLQSGFDMRFEGTLLDLELDDAARAAVQVETWGGDEVPAEVDPETGVPVVQRLERVQGI